MALPAQADLEAAMAGVDVLVNTVGIFRAAAEQSFDAIHVNAPARLYAAARRAGVKRIVHLSALGADAASPLPYLATKGAADAALLETPGVEACVVRPSLVFSADGASTRWFATLASLPVVPLPGGGRQRVQPVHLDDLLAALVRLVEAPGVPATLDVVGPRSLALRDYLALFQRAMGLRSPMATVPRALAGAGARLLARWLPRSPVDPDALAMLDRGSTADAAPLGRWLGRPPRPAEAFFDDLRGNRERSEAVLGWSVPLMRGSLALMWIATGVISLWVYPREASLALLAQVGLAGLWAQSALWSAALLDIALGIALLATRDRRWLYRAQLCLVGAYTLIITFWLPAQWAHPFGPVLKNLPLLAMILALCILDRPRGPDPR